jgi:hypothetical protein
MKLKIIEKTKNYSLFIIHNLKTFRTEQQVKNYINNILLKSGTFSLNKHEYITSEENVIKGEHFTEPEKNFSEYII